MLWGPIIHGPGPFTLRESKGPSQGEPRPKLYNAEHRTVFVMQPRTTQSSADPKPHQKKKGKPGIGPNLKENLRISGKATLIAVQCAAPDKPYFSALPTIPNNSGIGLMGQMSVL